jgi:hypothetical protein
MMFWIEPQYPAWVLENTADSVILNRVSVPGTTAGLREQR